MQLSWNISKPILFYKGIHYFHSSRKVIWGRTRWLCFSTFWPTFPIYRFLIEWESWVFAIFKLNFYTGGVHLTFWYPSKILFDMWKTSIGAVFRGAIFKDMQILYWFKTCNVKYLHDTFSWHSIRKFEICKKYKFY